MGAGAGALAAGPKASSPCSPVPAAPVGASDRRGPAGELPSPPVPPALGGRRRAGLGAHHRRREVPHGGHYWGAGGLMSNGRMSLDVNHLPPHWVD